MRDDAERFVAIIAKNINILEDAEVLRLLEEAGLSPEEATRFLWFCPFAFGHSVLERLGAHADIFTVVESQDGRPPKEIILVAQDEYLACSVVDFQYRESSSLRGSLDQEDYQRLVSACLWIQLANEELQNGRLIEGVYFKAVLTNQRLYDHVAED